MKHRAIRDLNQLSDNDLFYEIAIGLNKIYENCCELSESSKHLFENNNYRASNIIYSIANEEAAKYIILIDTLRCPRKNKKSITKQLAKFNDHMAKGVYAKLCGWSVSTYKELCSYIEGELDQYYLDGPMDIDWIFRNSIISNREEAFYVDYVQYDDEGHEWLAPKSNDTLGKSAYFTISPIISLVKALHNIGIENIESIKLFSDFWRTFEITDNTHIQELYDANLECLNILDDKDLLVATEEDQYSLVIKSLPFPLYNKDMKEKKISIQSLKNAQNDWCPEY
ncbi:MAG: hypothetical protein DIZ78_05505 [endosymbiont of Escarpia spicata]|uniref:AbiV family abortive infection protein n=1 Tax=endosymbiont of Escarpia spicata TaxID=2200908 RepID=A0A370DQ06_9GAMM|nr:MAG: hypothetical protein DIZ78_05505 [endosymbiont of Escarpia spicata]